MAGRRDIPGCLRLVTNRSVELAQRHMNRNWANTIFTTAAPSTFVEQAMKWRIFGTENTSSPWRPHINTSLKPDRSKPYLKLTSYDPYRITDPEHIYSFAHAVVALTMATNDVLGKYTESLHIYSD